MIDISTNAPRLAFIVAFGFVSLFADVAYEGMRGITGPFLALLGRERHGGRHHRRHRRIVRLSAAARIGPRSPNAPAPIGRSPSAGYVVQMAAVPLLAFAGIWWMAAVLIVLERTRQGDAQSRRQHHDVPCRRRDRPRLGLRPARGARSDRRAGGPADRGAGAGPSRPIRARVSLARHSGGAHDHHACSALHARLSVCRAHRPRRHRRIAPRRCRAHSGSMRQAPRWSDSVSPTSR